MKRRSRRRKVLLTAICVLILLALTEIGARTMWAARGAGFCSAHRTVYRSFYPTVAKLERERPVLDDSCVEILLLGGSVLHRDYGDIDHVLRERLSRATGRCVRIYNLSAPAHTSLDSRYKYGHITGRRFDWIIVYHGINEIRANNCPPEKFRSDYSHLSWYRLINAFERKAQSRWFIGPYTVKFVALKIADRLGLSGTLPTHEPDPASLDFGCEVKTEASFRENIEAVAERASRRNERVLVLSFAHHTPDDYTREAFEEGTLDYTAHTFPTELWGKPECVEAGITAQNRAARSVADAFENAYFVDQAALIPKEGRYFNDVCHLTHEGCERFVENILDTILDGL